MGEIRAPAPGDDGKSGPPQSRGRVAAPGQRRELKWAAQVKLPDRFASGGRCPRVSPLDTNQPSATAASGPPYHHDVLRRVSESTKAKRVLGFAAKTILSQMLDEVIPWVRQDIAAGRM